MDIDALVVRVKQLINKPNTTAADDTGKPKNAEVIASINEAYQQIYEDVAERLPDRWITQTTLSYPANTAAVALPTAAQQAQVLRLYWQSTGATIGTYQNPLQPAREREFVNMAETGTPVVYAITGTDLRIRPVPTVGVQVVISYLPALIMLAVAPDTPSVLPANWHHLIAYKAAIQLRQINEDPSGGLVDAYTEKMELFIAAIERRVPDNHVQQTEPNLTWQGS